MSDNININVTENIDQVNIVASEVVEVVDLNLYATTEDVTINVTEEIIQVNINKVTSSNITKTSDLINDGEDGTSTYVETDELGAVAFSNDYNDLDNLPTIPESVTKTSDLTNDGEDGVNPFITLEDIPPIDISTLVPYTGATQDVDLGENGISAGFFKFDTTPTDIPEVQGAMFWDEDDNTVDVILNGYRMKIGEDTFYPVKNQSGSTITKGTNVKFAGTVGSSGRLLILPFLANGTDPSYVYMGVTAEDIADGEDGKVLWFGRLRGLNTNAFNEGDILYASTTSAGGFQTAIPTGANNIVQVSAVIKKSVNQGVIFIRPQIEPLLFKPENVANKSTTTTLGTSDTLYPTQNAVKTYVDSKIKPVFSDTTIYTHTGTNVYTNLSIITIPPNTIQDGDIWEIEISTRRTSTGFSGACTLGCDFFGNGTGFIRGVAIGTTATSRTRIQKSIMFKNGNFYVQSGSGAYYHDFSVVPNYQVALFNTSIERTLYVGLTLSNSSDIAILDYVIFRKTN